MPQTLHKTFLKQNNTKNLPGNLPKRPKPSLYAIQLALLFLFSPQGVKQFSLYITLRFTPCGGFLKVRQVTITDKAVFWGSYKFLASYFFTPTRYCKVYLIYILIAGRAQRLSFFQDTKGRRTFLVMIVCVSTSTCPENTYDKSH